MGIIPTNNNTFTNSSAHSHVCGGDPTKAQSATTTDEENQAQLTTVGNLLTFQRTKPLPTHVGATSWNMESNLEFKRTTS